MDANMRFRLGNSIAYHNETADAAAQRVAAGKKAKGVDTSADAALQALHADAAEQLQDVLDAEPMVSAIDAAVAAQSIRRNTQPVPRRRQFVH